MNRNADQTTIMVVDDTPANLRLLDSMLRERGYRVVAFPRGDLALEAASRNPPDLILLDINMPGMNGFEVCERLKAEENLKEIPVLFISAMTETTDKVRGFAVGGLDYVIKPFAFEEVLARVETHLALQWARKEIVAKNRELDESYRKLKELESLREALTRMVVHDLRSPLMGILGYLELLEEEAEGCLNAEARDLLEHARAAATELTNRISTILDVYRLEERAMPLNMAGIDARALVEGALKGLGPQLRDVQVSIQTPAQSLAVTCDQDLVERVLANFVVNALKFSPPGSPLVVLVENRPEGVWFGVRDQGPGVPVEYRESIFNKFEQVDAWRQGQRRGTGLGLAFCKLAVEAHDGRIGVDCPEGGGSTFWFTIPSSNP